ncbi:MAG: DUF4142 domain-containing protein [Chitinophagales bacterium]
MFRYNQFMVIAMLTMYAVFSACNGGEKKQDSKDIAEERNNAKFSEGEKFDADFMVDVADIVLCEIMLSQTAIEKGAMQFTKDYAAKMIEAHNKIYTDLKSIAESKSITIPQNLSAEGEDTFGSIAKKDGNKFDEEYCEHMIDSHKTTIVKFERAAKEAYDSEIKSWAQNLLPQLRIDLDAAYACEDAHKK